MSPPNIRDESAFFLALYPHSGSTAHRTPASPPRACPENSYHFSPALSAARPPPSPARLQSAPDPAPSDAPDASGSHQLALSSHRPQAKIQKTENPSPAAAPAQPHESRCTFRRNRAAQSSPSRTGSRIPATASRETNTPPELSTSPPAPVLRSARTGSHRPRKSQPSSHH